MISLFFIHICWVVREKAARKTGPVVVETLSAAADPKDRVTEVLTKKATKDAKAMQRKAAFKKAVGKSLAAGKVAADEATNDEAEAARAQQDPMGSQNRPYGILSQVLGNSVKYCIVQSDSSFIFLRFCKV